MTQLLEWIPLLAFFVVFKLYGIYWATGVLMATSVGLLLSHRISTGRFKKMHLITAGVVVVLGTATLLLHDKRFIQWKPTVLLGAAALAFLASAVVGKKPLARRLLEGIFSEPVRIQPESWNRLNALWAFWFAFLAGLNIYVAQNFPEAVWVNFKVFGITVAMLVFMIPQVLWLNSKVEPGA